MNKFMNPRAAFGLRVINKLRLSSLTSRVPKTCSLLLTIALVLIQTPISSAATARSAPSVRLVFTTSFIDPNSVNNNAGFQQPTGIGGPVGSAVQDNIFGRATYDWQMPTTIGSQGAPCTIGVNVKTKEETPGATMESTISCLGEVDEKDGKTATISVFAKNKEGAKKARGTFTLVPRNYSEDRYYLELVVRLHGGMDIRFRYNIEQAAGRGDGNLEYDIDRPSQDYKNSNLTEARLELCQAEDSSDSKQKSFTYMKPGVQASSARC